MRHHVVAETMPLLSIPGEAGHAMRPEEPDLLGYGIAIGGEHAPFASGQILVRKEAKAADIANAAALPGQPCARCVRDPGGGAGGMRGIFYHVKIVASGDLHDPFHVTGIPAIMQHTDALRRGIDLGFDIVRRQIQVGGARDVNEHRHGARVANGIRRSHEGQRGTEHRITGADTQGEMRQVQRCSAVGHRKGVLDADKGGKAALELSRDRPHRQPPRA